MKAHHATLCLAVLVLGACGTTESSRPSSLVASDQVSVSGVSSGGYMAGQLHMAWADDIDGVAMIASGPYGCAEGNLLRAIGDCIKGGAVSAERSVAMATAAADESANAPLQGLVDDRVWVFRGASDSVIDESIPAAVVDTYQRLGLSTDAIRYVTNIDAAHGLPAVDAALSCQDMSSPFINDCDYDAAGELLQHITGVTATAADESTGALREFAQSASAEAGLAETGFVYTPPQCETERCALHVVLHGCSQSAAHVGDALARDGGYNRWADALGLVVVYPQVRIDASRNPLACWDWWGYTGPEYATRAGAQIQALRDILSRHAQGAL